MIERKAYQVLLNWKNKRQGKTALLIEGARGVGKSTLIAEFGRCEYRSVLIIDFSKISAEEVDLFQTVKMDFSRFFSFLSAVHGVELYPRESLIIFDEVQRFPPARELVKHLVADGRFDYLEAGTLLSLWQNVKDIVLPSEEESCCLNPLDFEEFLWASGDKPLADVIRASFEAGEPLPPALHKKATIRFREYLLSGGMPSVVDAWLKSHSLAAADDAKRQLLSGCLQEAADFGGCGGRRILDVLDRLPGELARAEKRFRLSSLGQSARRRNYEEAFFWLEEAQLMNPCRAADLTNGLALDRSSSAMKCYMADTGLLVTQVQAASTEENVYRAVILGRLGLNEGMLVENIVAQTLVAKGDRLFFYSQSGKVAGEERMEIDFLIVRPWEKAGGRPRVMPIEVKSGSRYSTLSLDRFRAKFANRVGTACVIHPGQYRKSESLLELPLYMAHCL